MYTSLLIFSEEVHQSSSHLHHICKQFNLNFCTFQVATNLEFADLTPRERAIVNFAMKVSQMEAIDDCDFAALEKEGLDQEDAWYIGAVAAFFAMSNRLANSSAMRPNEEFYSMGRMKRPKNTL